ncbi:MAG: prepilin-type N-terminal cleavage/methylation domain-containing protein [Burkholderiales bacterium]|nr:prepilin-type N-terminal cleavage/methylation domain-containing protein [Burkholderiales bacterium]
MKYQKAVTTGFSLIELMVTVSVFAIIVTIAAPNISEWISKAQIRSDAKALQNSIRFAQGEAAKRDRLTEFSLVNSTTTLAANAVVADDEMAWMVRAVPLSAEATRVLQADVFFQGEK